MKSIRLKIALFITLAVIASTTGTVSASVQEDDIGPCQGDNVAGLVVAVDSNTNTVTVQVDEETYCTVTINITFDHPIASLLGKYFGDVDVQTLRAALVNTQGCVVYDEVTNTGTWDDCANEGTYPVKVIGEADDENFLAILNDTVITVIISDEETAWLVRAALEELSVNLKLDENGGLIQVGARIADNHADGIGFGVLVKLYAMAHALAENSDKTFDEWVDFLIDEFQSGKGMGQLFQEYGKPSKVGVGHVRNDKEQKGNGPPPSDSNDTTEEVNENKPKKKPDKNNKGITNAQSNGGKAKAKGHDKPPR